MNPRPPGYEPGELPDCSTPRRFPLLEPPQGLSILRAGNGTRTRDPNLGKVVLYQLSYSRGIEGQSLSAGPPDCNTRLEQAQATMEARGIEPLTS